MKDLVLLGESDGVFTWLAKAYNARDIHLLFLTVDPKWDALSGGSALREAPRTGDFGFKTRRHSRGYSIRR